MLTPFGPTHKHMSKSPWGTYNSELTNILKTKTNSYYKPTNLHIYAEYRQTTTRSIIRAANRVYFYLGNNFAYLVCPPDFTLSNLKDYLNRKRTSAIIDALQPIFNRTLEVRGEEFYLFGQRLTNNVLVLTKEMMRSLNVFYHFALFQPTQAPLYTEVMAKYEAHKAKKELKESKESTNV